MVRLWYSGEVVKGDNLQKKGRVKMEIITKEIERKLPHFYATEEEVSAPKKR